MEGGFCEVRVGVGYSYGNRLRKQEEEGSELGSGEEGRLERNLLDVRESGKERNMADRLNIEISGRLVPLLLSSPVGKGEDPTRSLRKRSGVT